MIIGPDGRRYMTCEEYAKKYGYCTVTVQRHVHNGEIWVKTIRGRHYICEDDEWKPKPRRLKRVKKVKNR